MTDFDVAPLEVLRIGTGMREDSSALEAPGGALPEADAGVMTPVIENVIGALLSHAELIASAMAKTAASVEASALEYHDADTRAREEMVHLMMPGAADAEVNHAVERAQRSDEIGLARLLSAGDPDAAEQHVLDTPSAFEEAQERADRRAEARAETMRDVYAGDGSDDVPRASGGGREGLLTDPLDRDGS